MQLPPKTKLIIRLAVYFFIAVLAAVCLKLNQKAKALEKMDDPQLKFLSSYNYNVSQTPIYNALRDHGFAPKEILEITNRLNKCVNVKTLKPNDKYQLVLKDDGSFHNITLVRGLNVHYVAMCEDSLVNNTLTVKTETEKKSASGTIKSSLWESMISAGANDNLIMNYADLFAWSIDFLTDVRQGDTFGLVWNEIKSAGGAVISREITGAFYNGVSAGNKVSVKFDGQYYNEKGEISKRMFLRAPLQYSRISSMFSLRKHPILKTYRPHHGTDYAAPSGTPVSAVANGRVTYKAWKGGLGNYVEISHQFGYVTGYGHLSRFANIQQGQSITQGEIVGYVGSTGLSTGPHLHFQILQNGKFLNYLNINNRSAGSMPKQNLDKFKAGTKELLEELKTLGAKAV